MRDLSAQDDVRKTVQKTPLTRLEVVILNRIARSEQERCSRFEGQSKLKILLGSEILEVLRNKVVIDFGCGLGDESIEMASLARQVIGLDIVPHYLDIARAKASKLGLTNVQFVQSTECKADIIISLDAFEHFGNVPEILDIMHDLLIPGGAVYASFGPTWYHPGGGHLFSVFPWAHLIFSEAALCEWRKCLRDDGATRFHEVEGGLNQMTISRFEEQVRKSKLRAEFIRPVPIRPLRFLHCRLTREWTSAIVQAKLVRPS